MATIEIRDGLLQDLLQRASESQLSLEAYLENSLNERLMMQAKIEALEERETRLRLLTDNVSDLVCLHEPDGKYLFLSPSIKQLAAYEPDELIGKNPYNFFHPDDLEAIRNSHSTSL